MTPPHILVRGAAALASVLALASCADEAASVVKPTVPTGGAIFSHYVSIGNSIAAGVQSNGINDSTQRHSFAYLLAQSMGTRFAVPFLTKPGCTPPIANWQTGALVSLPGTTSTATTCNLRHPRASTRC